MNYRLFVQYIYLNCTPWCWLIDNRDFSLPSISYIFETFFTYPVFKHGVAVRLLLLLLLSAVWPCKWKYAVYSHPTTAREGHSRSLWPRPFPEGGRGNRPAGRLRLAWLVVFEGEKTCSTTSAAAAAARTCSVLRLGRRRQVVTAALIVEPSSLQPLALSYSYS